MERANTEICGMCLSLLWQVKVDAFTSVQKALRIFYFPGNPWQPVMNFKYFVIKIKSRLSLCKFGPFRIKIGRQERVDSAVEKELMHPLHVLDYSRNVEREKLFDMEKLRYELLLSRMLIPRRWNSLLY